MKVLLSKLLLANICLSVKYIHIVGYNVVTSLQTDIPQYSFSRKVFQMHSCNKTHYTLITNLKNYTYQLDENNLSCSTVLPSIEKDHIVSFHYQYNSCQNIMGRTLMIRDKCIIRHRLIGFNSYIIDKELNVIDYYNNTCEKEIQKYKLRKGWCYNADINTPFIISKYI